MSNKNNKKTACNFDNGVVHDIVVKKDDGRVIHFEARTQMTEEIAHFVHCFYEKHGKIMSKLAYE
jgi:hypothetical protein